MQPKLRLLLVALCAILLSFTTSISFAQTGTPTLTSDQQDYAPNSTATLTGSGFQPFEKVTVQVRDSLYNGQPTDGDNDVNPLHDPWEVTADADGNFVTTWYVDQYELGITLKATADGQTSGLHAETWFTDASNAGSLTITASVCAQGGTFTITYTPATGTPTTEPHNTPFTVTAKKGTAYTITSIAPTVNGNSYTGSATVSGTTPNANDFIQSVTLQYADNSAPALTGAAYSQSGSVSGCQPTQAAAAAAFSEANALVGYTDNCSSTLTATLTNTVVTGNNQSWTITYTYSVNDGNGNSLASQQYTTVGGDVTAPALTGIKYSQSGLINSCVPSQSAAEAAFSPSKATQGYTDNCANSLSATLTNTSVTGTNCSWTVTYNYTVGDGNGNSVTGRQYSESGSDQTPAALVNASAGPSSLNQTGVNACLSAATAFDATTLQSSLAALYSDNCASSVTATLKSTTPGQSNTNCSWSFTYTYTISDGCAANDFDVTITRSGSDQTAPLITGSNTTGQTPAVIQNLGSINVTYNPAVCGAVVTYTISANDGCSGAATPVLVNGLASGSTFPFGETVVKYSATDACNNTSYFQFTVNVGVASTQSTLTVTPISPSVTQINGKPTQQYSDKVTLAVTVTNGATPSTCSNGPAATAVNFYIDGQLMNSSPIALTSDGSGNLTAQADFALTGNFTPCGNNPKKVKAVLVNKNTTYFTVADPAEKELNVVQEDATVNYTGPTFISTAYNSVDVLMTASVKDIVDSYPGNISTAKVKFVVTDYVNTSIVMYQSGWMNVNLSNPSILTDGYAAAQWAGAPVPINPGDQNQYNVYVYVDCDGTAGNYKSDEDVSTLNIFRTDTRDFITGGGYINPTNSLGTQKADNGKKINFGFNIKWNKSYKNLQGKLNVIYRKGTKVYQIKTNATNSLSVTEQSACLKSAVFTAKGNITDVTDPLNPITVASGLNLELKITDNNVGGSDSWGLSLYDGSTLVFSSTWSSGTIELPLGGGNVWIHSGTDCPNANITSTPATRTFDQLANRQLDPAISDFGLSAYPNPTQSQFNIKLQSSNTIDPISIVVYGVNGNVVEQKQNLKAGQSLVIGGLYRPGVYVLEMIQGKEHKQLKLVKIPD